MVTEPTFALEYTQNDPFYKAADDGNPYADLDMIMLCFYGYRADVCLGVHTKRPILQGCGRWEPVRRPGYDNVMFLWLQSQHSPWSTHKTIRSTRLRTMGTRTRTWIWCRTTVRRMLIGNWNDSKRTELRGTFTSNILYRGKAKKKNVCFQWHA